MVSHNWNTYKNEAVNVSAASYTPKRKTYSLTNSLDTRVEIAASVQNLGYAIFWGRVFSIFDLDMNSRLRYSLDQRDKRKDMANTVLATKEGKAAKI